MRATAVVVTSFQASQIAALAASGWAQCPSVADAVAGSGLPPVTVAYLQKAFTAEQWHAAEVAVSALRDRFSAARFADEASWWTVLVPDPDQLDTRGSMDPGAYGPALGNYTEVTGADAGRFTVDGVDVRELMIRQVWGARLLRNGASLPDCEANDRWTFTLFPGEGLTDGLAAPQNRPERQGPVPSRRTPPRHELCSRRARHRCAIDHS